MSPADVRPQDCNKAGLGREVVGSAPTASQRSARSPSLLARRTSTAALNDTGRTRLGRSAEPLARARPGQSGVVLLRDGRDAFAARMHIADAAERSLDVQYYIWHKDLSGTLLLDALRRAAERGVRVRLLLDDNNTSELDETLSALNDLEHIEVRLFNPFFVRRRWRALGFLYDFKRLNRRMHNKSFTADNQATIVGGRNIGDEYFDAGHETLFVDLDVLAIGPVVADVSADFDRYWASASAYPVDCVLAPVAPAAAAELSRAAMAVENDPAAVAYTEAIANSPFVADLLAHRLAFEWTTVHMVSDDPAKALGRASRGELLWSRLQAVLKTPSRRWDLVSAYFVPGRPGVDYFVAMAARGVKVTVLTNSLEATDVAAVHAGYAKRRKALLRAGVALYEMKRTPSAGLAKQRRRVTGSSGASLHAKTFAVDDEQLFVGSFNFDPRSVRLNTELGFVIDSPTLGRSITEQFARDLDERAYQVQLTADGSLQWLERVDGNTVIHDREPGTRWWQRVAIAAISMLPIEWLL